MIIGTAGHIDHGKTSLVRRLTGVDTDRLKEEKERGITIALGFAYWPQSDGRIVGFIDVPGHEKLVHTMLAGASGIDLLLLVVAADDGVMPQTREHLDIARLLGIERTVVALTKADLVEGERLAEAQGEIAALLAATPFADAPILPVSTVTGDGIDELAQLLRELAQASQLRRSDGAFRLAVDRCFTLPGAGTVVTGTVLSGKVSAGDGVTVSPSGIVARVRSIHAQNRPAESGAAGDRCALNLAGPDVAKDAIVRGDMIVSPALHAPATRIDAELTVLASEKKPLAMWQPVRLHHGSSETGAASSCSATRSRPARPGRSSSYWRRRSPPRRSIASCCATPAPRGRSAAAASSTCARRSESAAARNARPNSLPSPVTTTPRRCAACSMRRRIIPISMPSPATARSARRKPKHWPNGSGWCGSAPRRCCRMCGSASPGR